MTRRERFLALGAAALLFAAGLGRAGAAEQTAEKTKEADKPRESGLVEKATSHLAQLDITLSGPREEIEKLEREDFTLKINYERVTNFILDRVCSDPRAPQAGRAGEPATATVVPRRASYLFYFDHPHLTMPGRARALDMAREMIPRLLAGGGRAMIVSNARGVRTIAPFSSDPGALLDALQRLEDDHGEWDFYPHQEPERVAEVMHALNKDGVERAISRARIFYMEDRWRGERDARRLTMTLGLLGDDVDPPKAVLYFADTMRNNPGVMYLNLFPESSLRGDPRATGPNLGNAQPQEMNLLDRVIREASAHGIRFYPVAAQGLAAPYTVAPPSLDGSYHATLNVLPSMIAGRDAEDTLANLGLETGGKAFLNGLPADKIVDRLLEDLSCVFLFSFDAKGFPEDQSLRVVVKTRNPHVKIQARGQIVIQSESARRTSRLLAAFAAPDAVSNEVPIHMNLIPTGYVGDAFTALVQVLVAGKATPSSTWDVGTSLVSRERVRDEGSGRIFVGAPDVPVVFEQEMRFTRGPYELVSVAQEALLGDVAARRDEGSWPDLDQVQALVGPIAVVQPATAAFLRNGKSATSGALARDESEMVRTDLPAALVVLACRGKQGGHALRIERSLEGATRADFPPLVPDLSVDRCALFQDVVRAGTMSPGAFRYVVRVLDNGTEIARGERKFSATAPGRR